MTIIQITATPETSEDYARIYGLGDDQKIYEWLNGEWQLMDRKELQA